MGIFAPDQKDSSNAICCLLRKMVRADVSMCWPAIPWLRGHLKNNHEIAQENICTVYTDHQSRSIGEKEQAVKPWIIVGRSPTSGGVPLLSMSYENTCHMRSALDKWWSEWPPWTWVISMGKPEPMKNIFSRLIATHSLLRPFSVVVYSTVWFYLAHILGITEIKWLAVPYEQAMACRWKKKLKC